MPDTAELVTRSYATGWLFNPAQHVAHYFDAGYSVCHRWIATTLDRPAAPGATRCPTCKERVSAFYRARAERPSA